MRIHANTLTANDVYKAARIADVTLEKFNAHGSRKRSHAFEILLSGNSSRNAMGQDFKAATWDQWGIFLNALFEADDSIVTTYYDSYSDFRAKTFHRFDDLTLDDACPDHRWENDGTGRQRCKRPECDAHFSW